MTPQAATTAPEQQTVPIQMTGAQMVVECLKRLGVHTIFGYPGGAILPIYDALYESGIDHVLVRHEQAAIHGAEGFARATGKVGVVMATSGPGATNLVTGITDAYMDSTPVVIITGQVPSYMIGRDAFQEADVFGITMPITKHNYQVRDAADLPRILAEAFHIAGTGRPGPVLVDIPKDVSNQVAPFVFPEKISIRGYNPSTEPSPLQIERVCAAIAKAKRPLLYIGGGIISADASEQIRAFARQTGIPVVSTLMGLGAFPPSDPLFVGMLGMHGTYAANMAVYHCDLLIACGVRFDDRVTGKLERFSPHSQKVHIDIDPAEIGKNVKIDYPIVADVKKALDALLAKAPHANCDEWVYDVQVWCREYPLSYENSSKELKPQYVIDLLDRMTNSEAIVTTEVGQHQMWAAHFYRAKEPRTFITSGGLGTMGYGFPAAIGAQLAKPDATVVCVAGDASLQMNIQEFQTIAERHIPVKVFVINNGFLGMVRQWQEMFHGNRLSESKISAPDFKRVAEAFNVKGLRAETPEEAEKAIAEALAYPGPVVVDFLVEETEKVFPMVPPGKGNDEMIVKGWEK
ncbi:acetolactate synthase large subunit [Effusibacillus lacus]|uniref:Acetolactate synthase n=1 Tax=Effusibacillus lacus TaxID=1348429 RepID=A0A292YEF0_9BACL|nr:acetolactate synthase large subunit [Effusibacillus lacus]TCS68938.1 acetolactate synthase large subunit [Effusibacillus lacus]GAX91492.1 acetolactate synthase [Effusibacillus lacus]